MTINYKFEGKLEDGTILFGCNKNGYKIDREKIYAIKALCNEWKIDFTDLIVYFIEHLTIEEAEKIIDYMDLSGIRELFGIKE